MSENGPTPASYEDVAAEYYDPRLHPTSHNLNRLSRAWLNRSVPESVDPAAALEVGAGDSALAAILHARGGPLAGLSLQDASLAMLAHSQRWRERGARTEQASATAMRREADSVDLLVASLADPYNTPQFWREARRVLRPGGLMLMTLPSYEWATRFRSRGQAADKAEFLLRDGRRVDLPSTIVPLHEQLAMMAQAGLMPLGFETLGLEALPAGDPVSPKSRVFGDGPSSLVWGFRARRSS